MRLLRLLASGSDDYNVHIWNALEGRSLACMQTGHIGNIFSVKVHIVMIFAVVTLIIVCAIFW